MIISMIDKTIFFSLFQNFKSIFCHFFQQKNPIPEMTEQISSFLFVSPLHSIFPTNFFNLFFRHFSHNKVEIGPKINKLLVTHWTRALNATLRFDVHRSWGYIDRKTGIANGMFGAIQRKEADISGEQHFS